MILNRGRKNNDVDVGRKMSDDGWRNREMETGRKEKRVERNITCKSGLTGENS